MIVQCKAGTTNEIQLARGETLQITNRPSEWPRAQRESERGSAPQKNRFDVRWGELTPTKKTKM